MKDGIMFQLFMASGILLTGIFTLFAASGSVQSDFRAIFSIEGVIGGLVWTVGNVLTVPIVTRIGLGLGLSIWGGMSIVVSFLIGLCGLPGLTPDTLTDVVAGVFGIIFGVASLLIFSFVKPELEQVDQARSLLPDDVLLRPNGAVNGSDDKKPNRVVGVIFAFSSGMIYGVQFLPFQYWDQHRTKPAGVSKILFQIRFFFSQFAGTFVGAVLIFVAECVRTKNSPKGIEPAAVGASMVGGVMWSVAAMGSMVATADLGATVGFPLSVSGAFLVNCLVSYFGLGEIRGGRNTALFGTAVVVNVAGCVLLSLAKA
eukprot:TRINITY_DN7774_c0_g1_i2.p1 TRINITY_DN7774_c0_g1~~TRINITY_DN7774_c0_g1_i2.p1  ORF type:complete len:314 (+),score=59.83 TRINITY_DN7774_c0_g1_i2:114-1055(+)